MKSSNVGKPCVYLLTIELPRIWGKAEIVAEDEKNYTIKIWSPFVKENDGFYEYVIVKNNVMPL